MEKTVPNKHSRRHSTGNLMLELTGYEDVLSRYLSPPLPSCHDNCKPHSPGGDHPTIPRSTRKRSNKTDIDSAQGLKKPFTPIPRSPTRHVKNQVKSRPTETKRQDSKSKSDETDPFYIPPARITRRYSDANLSAKCLGNDRVSPAVGGSVRNGRKYDKRIDSRTDVKPVKSATKTPAKSATKTPIDSTDSTKAPTSKTINSSTKPKIDHGSKNSKFADPIGQVQEKANKSQSQSQNIEKDETPRSESQSNGSIAASAVKKTENQTRVRKQAKENEELSSQKLKFKQGKVIGSQSESGGPRKHKFGKGKVLDENKTGKEDGKSLRRLSSDGVVQTPESNSVSVALKQCEVQENKEKTRVNNVIEETASRLIQTRKSKVQALVGAFEMISTNEF